jgi:hypothetical protein
MNDPLAPYFSPARRQPPNLGGRDGVRGQVDAILNALQVPASFDAEGDWRIQSDAGPVSLVFKDEADELVLLQIVERIGKERREHAELMHRLLELNYDSDWARYAIAGHGDEEVLVMTARLPAAEADRRSVERLLASGLSLSRRFDEATGKEPPKPAAPEPVATEQPTASRRQQPTATGQPVPGEPQPPADWYPDPKGEARLRYWNGDSWTDHTSP